MATTTHDGVDNTATGCGLVTTWGMLLFGAVDLTQVINMVIAGVFGLLTSLAVAILNHYLREWRECKRREEREK